VFEYIISGQPRLTIRTGGRTGVNRDQEKRGYKRSLTRNGVPQILSVETAPPGLSARFLSPTVHKFLPRQLRTGARASRRSQADSANSDTLAPVLPLRPGRSRAGSWSQCRVQDRGTFPQA